MNYTILVNRDNPLKDRYFNYVELVEYENYEKEKIRVEKTTLNDAIIKAEKCRVDRIEEVFLDTKEEEIHELLMMEDKEFINKSISEKIN